MLTTSSAVWALTPEPVDLKFDNRSWKVGWSQEKGAQRMVEWVVDGQTVENWKELVTEQFYPNLKGVPPKQFSEGFLKQLKGASPGVWINQISDDGRECIIEWRTINDPQNPPQHEIDRIFSGSEGLHVVHYVVKQAEMPASERSKWISLLRSARIAGTAKR